MNDIVLNKVQSIQRCAARAREEHQAAGPGFGRDYTRQDAAILNITRACEQAIDLANHVIRTKKIGIPTDSAESFPAVRMDIVEAVITAGLDDLLAFSDLVLRLPGS